MKIAYIDRSFHKKTSSTDFLFNILQNHFEVKRFWDNRWDNGKGAPFGKIKDEGFDTILLFQDAYDPNYLYKKYGFKNIIWVPMADQYNEKYLRYFSSEKNYKVIAFSEEIYLKSILLGIETLRIKFYPEPKSFKKKIFEKIDVFFWYRKNHINISQIKILFKSKDINKIYIHNSPDPSNEKDIFLSLDKEIRKKIVIGEWSERKEKYLNILDKYNLFIAPRLKEGIGLSFLEAMSRGLIVLGNKDTTMNEYIRNGYNGILFDAYYPEPIEKELLSENNLSEMSKNLYKTLLKGYERWKKSEIEIINFIDKNKDKKTVSLPDIKQSFEEWTPQSQFHLLKHLREIGDNDLNFYRSKFNGKEANFKVKMEFNFLFSGIFPLSKNVEYKKLSEVGLMSLCELIIDYYYKNPDLKVEEKNNLKNFIYRYLEPIKNKDSRELLILGEMFYILNIYKEAKNYLKKVLEKPEIKRKVKALFLLGEICKKTENLNCNVYYKKALSILEKLKNKGPGKMYLIASLNKQLGNYKKAKYWYKKTIKSTINPSYISASYFHLGEIELARRNVKSAVENYKMCLRLNPHHKKAIEELKKLEHK